MIMCLWAAVRKWGICHQKKIKNLANKNGTKKKKNHFFDQQKIPRTFRRDQRRQEQSSDRYIRTWCHLSGAPGCASRSLSLEFWLDFAHFQENVVLIDSMKWRLWQIKNKNIYKKTEKNVAVATDHLLQQTVYLISSFVPKLCFRKVLNSVKTTLNWQMRINIWRWNVSFESLLSYDPPPKTFL